jgi:hypothetical protein
MGLGFSSPKSNSAGKNGEAVMAEMNKNFAPGGNMSNVAAPSENTAPEKTNAIGGRRTRRGKGKRKSGKSRKHRRV